MVRTVTPNFLRDGVQRHTRAQELTQRLKDELLGILVVYVPDLADALGKVRVGRRTAHYGLITKIERIGAALPFRRCPSGGSGWDRTNKPETGAVPHAGKLAIH